jgi:uncharacterized protein (DUF2336 family)
MSGANETAETLVELAKQRSLARSRRLHGEMSDLFLADAHRLNDRDRAAMSGILRKLLLDIEMDIRAAMAARIGDEGFLPAELAARLDDSEFEWARPVLFETGALQNLSLIEQIDQRARAHRLVQRLRQGGAMTEDLAAPIGEDALEALLRHGDAAVSRIAMEVLVAEARTLDRYREPLLHRQDLPADVATPLYWTIAAALRFALLRGFAVDALLLDDLIEAATRAALGRRDSGEPTDRAAARALVARLQETGGLKPGLLANALRYGHFAVAAAILAQLARLDFPLAMRLLLDADGESLAIVWKAQAIERVHLAAVMPLLEAGLTMNREARGRTPETARALTFFDKISAPDADAVCRHWRLSADYKRAVESLARNA